MRKKADKDKNKQTGNYRKTGRGDCDNAEISQKRTKKLKTNTIENRNRQKQGGGNLMANKSYKAPLNMQTIQNSS